MILEQVDRQLLAGDFGRAAQRAMKLLVRYGEVLGADRFIDIESAHIDSCLYHGQSGLDFVNSFLGSGDRVRVPATLNVTAIDLVHPETSVVDPAVTADQRAMIEAYVELGCTPTLTCAPYHRLQRPRLGQHVAWAESNAIVFANSVLGARTDRYGDFTDFCAALTGRVPLAGLHRASNRAATLLLQVPGPGECGMDRDLYFAALGYCLGEVAGGRVAAIVGMPFDSQEDELKALGAAAASSGAVAMFHAVGVTPEAETLEQACAGSCSGLDPVELESAALLRAASGLCQALPGEQVAAMCVGTPHFSLAEFEQLARLVRGRAAADAVQVLVSTSRETAARLQKENWAQDLWVFGVDIVVDTCTYLSPVALQGEGAVVTNSAKWAHYAPGNIRRRAALMGLKRCVRCAVAGEVVP